MNTASNPFEHMIQPYHEWMIWIGFGLVIAVAIFQMLKEEPVLLEFFLFMFLLLCLMVKFIFLIPWVTAVGSFRFITKLTSKAAGSQTHNHARQMQYACTGAGNGTGMSWPVVEEAYTEQPQPYYRQCPVPKKLYKGVPNKEIAHDILTNNRWKANEHNIVGIWMTTEIEYAEGYANFNGNCEDWSGMILELDVYFGIEDVVHDQDIYSDPSFEEYARQYGDERIAIADYAHYVLGKYVVITDDGGEDHVYIVLKPNGCEYFSTDLVKVSRTYSQEEFEMIKRMKMCLYNQ